MKKYSLFWLLALILTVLFIFRPFFKNQLINTDDGEFHAARSANYYLALRQGQLPVRWAPNLNNGYGYPIFLFNYHLPYMLVTTLYTITNIPFQLALNLVTILSAVSGAVGIGMIALRKKIAPSWSTLCSAVYVFSSYSLINVFLRGAIGEIVFFGLLPWILLGIEQIVLQQKNKLLLWRQLAFTAALVLFLLTHLQSLLIAAPVLISYTLFLLRSQKITLATVANLVLPGIIASLLVAWFWIPALSEKQYVVLNNHSTLRDFVKEFPTLKQLVFPWLLDSDMFAVRKIVTIGYPVLIAISLGIFAALKKRQVSSKIIFWLVWFAVGLFLTTSLSTPIWHLLPALQYMQFPWRMLWLTTFAGTMVLIESWPILVADHRLRKTLASLLLVFLVFSVLNHARYRGTQQWPDYELLEYFKPASSFNEHLPIWASEYTRQYPTEKVSFRRPGTTYFQDEKPSPATYVSLHDMSWTGTTMRYNVDTTEPVEVIQKTHYFPGWKVYQNNEPLEFEYEDQEFPGHIVFKLPAGRSSITAQFTNDTPDRKIADGLTVVGFGCLVGYAIYLAVRARKGSHASRRA